MPRKTRARPLQQEGGKERVSFLQCNGGEKGVCGVPSVAKSASTTPLLSSCRVLT